jgi:hypothetical protein
MTPNLVLIGSVILQSATRPRFVEHDPLIDAFAPNRADEARRGHSVTVSRDAAFILKGDAPLLERRMRSDRALRSPVVSDRQPHIQSINGDDGFMTLVH